MGNLSKGYITWNEELFDKTTKEIIKNYGFIPPAGYLRNNGYQSYMTYFYSKNYTYESINKKYNVYRNPKLNSRNGMYWKSMAEACFSNFLYTRGINHIHGEKYAIEYKLCTGRNGYFDCHFIATEGDYKDKKIDVEIWGDNPGGHVKQSYALKRKEKEEFNKDNPCLLYASPSPRD